MAVVPRVSTSITNATTNPPIVNGPPRNGARMRHLREVIASAATDDATSVYRFFRVKSSDTVVRVYLSAADATTAGAVNCGLYQTVENGSAVVDADLFAAALDLAGGPYKNLDITFQSGEYTFAESMMPLWQAIGLTADPFREYDMCLVVSTTFNGGPTSILLCADVV
jgi:hypothetical protein